MHHDMYHGGGGGSHYYGWGPGWGWGGGRGGISPGLLGGVLLGEALAGPSSTTVVTYLHPPYDMEKAKLDNALAESQNALAMQNAAALTGAKPTAMSTLSEHIQVQVQIPQGIQSGEKFRFTTSYGQFDGECPSNIDGVPGRVVLAQFPSPRVIMAMPVATPALAARTSPSLPHTSNSTADSSQPQLVRAVKDHIVNQQDPKYAAHYILSMQKNEVATLVLGSPTSPNPHPYEDYVLVQLHGRIGRVSRFVLEPVPMGLPAQTTPPPPALA
jgi:hypothetical protein